MKKYYFILLGLSFLIGCKHDPDPDPCETTIKPIVSELFEFLPDTFYESISFKNQSNNIWKFNQLIFQHDTVFSANPCNPASERLSLTYNGNIAVNEINYFLSPDRYIYINIGPDNSCESMFFLCIDSLSSYTYIDTLLLNNETLYNVYHRDADSGICCIEMYFNKQYGVVGFNWQGEWYVLETDSL